MDAKPIGLVKGPAETHHEFRFVTPDKIRLKSGEFIYYFLDGKKVICRVTKRSPLRLFPDAFLSKPDILPEKIIRALGMRREFELFEIKACILGYYDENLGFTNPRIPPQPGQPVYIAEEDVIQDALMKKRAGEAGSIHIGYLLNRDEDVPVVLDTALVTSEHMCILASTGSGKSYLAGVVAEELLRPYNCAALLVLDPHSEYATLKEVEGLKEFVDGDYRPYVRVFGKDEIKIRLSELEYDELINLLPGLTDKMEALLKKAYDSLAGTKFTSDELISKIAEVSGDPKDVTVKALSWRIRRYVQSVEIIDDYIHMELKDILRPGQASILQLSELSDIEQQILVSVMLNRALNARINAEKGLTGERLEYPIFAIIEEAHRFASRDSKSYSVLRTILSEGRKFGVGVCLISQRPSKIDSDILSQCMTQVIMRIVNPADQENIKSSVESIGRELIEELSGLTKGQALVAGVAVNSPVLVRVRKRFTTHGGMSKNAPEEWQKWLSLQGKEEIGIKQKQKRLFWDE